MRKQLTLLFLLITGIVKAYDFSEVCPSGQTLYYTIEDEINYYVSVTFPGPTIDSAYLNYSKPKGKLSIPEQVMFEGNQYVVASIGTCAFAKCLNLNDTLVIPVSITTIGRYAFLDCDRIPTLVFNARSCENAVAAFEGCKFTSIIFGDGVTTIPDGIFTHSIALETISLPNAVQSIGNRAFYNCPNLKSVSFPEYMTKIGDYAFCDCIALDSVSTINVDSIGKCAFRNAVKLSEICLGVSVRYVANEAFFNCRSLTSLTFDVNVGDIGNYAFYYCDQIDTVYCHPLIPPEITENTFSEGILSGVLCLNCEAKNAYCSSMEWNRFSEIWTYDAIRLYCYTNNSDYGTVSVSGQYFCIGDMGVMEAIPNVDCVFCGWDDGNMDNPRSVRMESDTTFLAFFSADTTLACSDRSGLKAPYVIAVKDKILVFHSEGKNVYVYNITGSLVFHTYCKEEKASFAIPKRGIYLVCIGDKPHCFKVYLGG